MPKPDAIIFDLDGTLLDRSAAFIKVAHDFYNRCLHNLATHTRNEAVAMMVRWLCWYDISRD